MPKVRVDLPEGRSIEEKKAILDAIHQSLVTSIQIPSWDRLQFLHEYASSHMYIPENVKGPFINIDITLYPGRSKEAKRRLFKLLTESLVPFGFDPQDIMITLHEPSINNWGVKGVPADEVNLGYSLEV
jgi:phenylpyruvate tautomerase PptA (4-oxalocrotonate tautomerase family)